jgi:hypothetical protein
MPKRNEAYRRFEAQPSVRTVLDGTRDVATATGRARETRARSVAPQSSAEAQPWISKCSVKTRATNDLISTAVSSALKLLAAYRNPTSAIDRLEYNVYLGVGRDGSVM